MDQFIFKKQFGQNFLNNFETIINFCDLSNIKKGDTVLEIGPGSGVITEELLNRGAEVIAIEIDQELVDLLKVKFKGNMKFKVMNADILSLDFDELGLKEYKLISALPYNISKMIISKFLTINNCPKEMILIMQKEVAEDYAYIKGQRKFLNIYAQIYCTEVEYLGTISKDDFIPVPKVDGGIVRFKLNNKKKKHDKDLLRLIRSGFVSPRKKLSSNLANIGYDKSRIESILDRIGSNKNSRAGELAYKDWIKLYSLIRNDVKGKDR